MTLLLLAQFVLGMIVNLYVTIPASGNVTGRAAVVLYAHMVLGAALLVVALVLTGLAVAARRRLWLISSAIGAAGIALAGDHGYRKPDRRLFQFALDGMGVAAGNTLYVGNDMYRDIYGAREAGLATVMFDSDQGVKVYRDCAPDYTITDFRDLLDIFGLPRP